MAEAWLIDERHELSFDDAANEARESLGFDAYELRRPLAVLLNELTIRRTGQWFQWFGRGARIRFDVLIVTAGDDESQVTPWTFRVPKRLQDDADLEVGEGGLLVYHGHPRHFIAMFLMASRDDHDAQDLGALLSGAADTIGVLSGAVVGLTSAAPEAATVQAAATAAVDIGGHALKLLDRATNRTLGWYQNTWFRHRDDMGLGFHPADGGRYHLDDLEIAFEIRQDRPQSSSASADA